MTDNLCLPDDVSILQIDNGQDKEKNGMADCSSCKRITLVMYTNHVSPCQGQTSSI